MPQSPEAFEANFLGDPSNPQFEPKLAWLENLRKVYEESEGETEGGGND